MTMYEVLTAFEAFLFVPCGWAHDVRHRYGEMIFVLFMETWSSSGVKWSIYVLSSPQVT